MEAEDFLMEGLYMGIGAGIGALSVLAIALIAGPPLTGSTGSDIGVGGGVGVIIGWLISRYKK
ncbi:hypothetical protein M1O55_04480 [Dehalococcoidia bacterium]|nr:hypothetical protein [Dehalococcoidia bacterium]